MIKAIETEYAGVLFRSKLEAMHAKFFDMNNISWIYEPVLISNEYGDYLPDFYLPDMDIYFEVKGNSIPGREKAFHVLAREHFKEEKHSIVHAVSNGREIDITYFGERPNFKDDIDGNRTMYDDKGIFSRCNKCDKVFLRNENGYWHCGICGHYDGDGGFVDIEFKLPSIRQDWNHK